MVGEVLRAPDTACCSYSHKVLSQSGTAQRCLQKRTKGKAAPLPHWMLSGSEHRSSRIHRPFQTRLWATEPSVQALAMQPAAAQDEADAIPQGYQWYETMILLRPDMDGESRDVELAKFEAYLQKQDAVGIDVMVRNATQRLAYPIKGYWEGIYVLYTYAANPATTQGVQKLLSTPVVGAESNILRHMTFKN